MYHVSAKGVDEHMMNVHYYYYERCGWLLYCLHPSVLLILIIMWLINITILSCRYEATEIMIFAVFSILTVYQISFCHSRRFPATFVALWCQIRGDNHRINTSSIKNIYLSSYGHE